MPSTVSIEMASSPVPVPFTVIKLMENVNSPVNKSHKYFLVFHRTFKYLVDQTWTNRGTGDFGITVVIDYTHI